MLNRLVASSYYAGLFALLLAVGGLIYRAGFETPAPSGGDTGLQNQAMVIVALAVFVACCGLWLVRRHRRSFLLGNLTWLVFVPVTLGLSEAVARCFTPPWPAVGLNGVVPGSDEERLGRNAEIERESVARGVGLNSWGLRDLERKRRPAPGVRRIAFVGDSYLEESTPMPVSVRTEQMLNRPQGQSGETAAGVEVINLGVTATGPDEYFYRTRQIALPLGIQHCVLFLYSGNDLDQPPRTLSSLGGIVALYPRGSLFSELGLTGMNHLMTNHERAVYRNRLETPARRAREQELQAAFANADDAAAPAVMLAVARMLGMPPLQSRFLEEQLQGSQMAPLYAALRHPDRNLFQPAYLQAALQKPDLRNRLNHHAEHWILKTRDLCRSQGVAFSVVIIPEGCQVDSRMNGQWEPLADMRSITKPFRIAAQALVKTLRSADVEVLDLHETLQDVPGTYLNLDGHWSDEGVERVSEAVAKMLRKSLD